MAEERKEGRRDGGRKEGRKEGPKRWFFQVLPACGYK
jgi:hypothetical protein